MAFTEDKNTALYIFETIFSDRVWLYYISSNLSNVFQISLFTTITNPAFAIFNNVLLDYDPNLLCKYSKVNWTETDIQMAKIDTKNIRNFRISDYSF